MPAHVLIRIGPYTRLLVGSDLIIYILTTQNAWDEGFTAYRDGAWATARIHLQACDAWKAGGKGDGPARVLLGFMAEHGGEAPVGWKGVRELTEK